MTEKIRQQFETILVNQVDLQMHLTKLEADLFEDKTSEHLLRLIKRIWNSHDRIINASNTIYKELNREIDE